MTSPACDVLVVAEDAAGHHTLYAELLTKALQLSDLRIETVYLSSVRSPGKNVHIRKIRRSMEIRKDLLKAMSRAQAAVFLSADEHLLLMLSLPMSRCLGIFLRSAPPFVLNGSKSRLRGILIRLLIARGLIPLHVEMPGSKPAKPFHPFRDPSPFAGDADSLGEISPPVDPEILGQAYAMFGVFDERKQVYEALIWLKDAHPRSTLVCLGVWVDEHYLNRCKKLARQHQLTLVTPNQSLTQGQLMAGIQNCMTPLVLNRNEGSSGILMGCLHVGKRPLVSGSASLRRASRILGLDWVDLERPSTLHGTPMTRENGAIGEWFPSDSGHEFTDPILEQLQYRLHLFPPSG